MSAAHDTDAHGVAPGGAIHDIGYRHYEGPRLGAGAVSRALFVDGLRGAYGIGRAKRARVVPFLLLAFACAPALIWGMVTTILRFDELPVTYTELVLMVQVLVIIFVAAQVPVLVSRDLRYRVVSLYFSRPLSRLQYVFARSASIVVAVFVFLATPLTILFACALLAELPVGDQLPGYLRGLAAAALASLLLSGIAMAVASFTIRRGLGVAAIITVLLLASGLQGFAAVLAFELGSQRLEEWSAVVSPVVLVDAITSHLLGADSEFVEEPSLALGAAFLGVWLAYVLLCLALLVVRYRKVGVS